MQHTPKVAHLVVAAVVAGGVVVALSLPASSDGAQVTRGEFGTLAAGAGQDISGQAQMVRRADGTTSVSIHVQGLRAGGQYASHVHNQPCATGGGAHFQQVPGAGATPPNEIWLGDGPFTANPAGIVNENATAPYAANADAVSVVLHDLSLPSTANRVACADLS